MTDEEAVAELRRLVLLNAIAPTIIKTNGDLGNSWQTIGKAMADVVAEIEEGYNKQRAILEPQPPP